MKGRADAILANTRVKSGNNAEEEVGLGSDDPPNFWGQSAAEATQFMASTSSAGAMRQGRQAPPPNTATYDANIGGEDESSTYFDFPSKSGYSRNPAHPTPASLRTSGQGRASQVYGYGAAPPLRGIRAQPGAQNVHMHHQSSLQATRVYGHDAAPYSQGSYSYSETHDLGQHHRVLGRDRNDPNDTDDPTEMSDEGSRNAPSTGSPSPELSLAKEKRTRQPDEFAQWVEDASEPHIKRRVGNPNYTFVQYPITTPREGLRKYLWEHPSYGTIPPVGEEASYVAYNGPRFKGDLNLSIKTNSDKRDIWEDKVQQNTDKVAERRRKELARAQRVAVEQGRSPPQYDDKWKP